VAPTYAVGDFEVRPGERRVLCGGAPVALGSRAFDLLLCLIEHRDRVVDKSELLELVWPGVVVEEANLTVHVSALRKLLGAQAVATVPGRGYRFAMAVAETTSEAPVRENRHSLPAERDAFVGRAGALGELSQRIRSGARLVSVLGIGGTGKTRLATRYGRNALSEFPGGVWFCDLAPARGLDGVVSAVAHGLNVPLGRDDPVVQLGHAIAGRGRCLVILDNFEQVARDAQSTLGLWLDRAEQACFVVTTREVLGLPGEDVLALPPLPSADAVALFVQRAAAARSDFHPGVEDQSAIAALVDLLDGLPLAIELAAARVRVMPPRQLLQRMSERFKLLVSKGGRPDRQATLRASFDWSWDLLPPHEKAALAQLSVFECGFTLVAAEAVIDLAAFDDAPWSVDVIHALVDKSFVRPRGDDRFDLLVSVQAYAAEHLQTEGRYAGSGAQAMTAAQIRAIAWFAAMGRTRAIQGRCADLDNLVTACRRAMALGDSDSAAGALDGAWDALSLRGPFETGVELAEAVCAMRGLNERAAAHAQSVLAHALVVCGRPAPARPVFERALACAVASSDRLCEAWVMFRLGVLHFDEGRMDDARAHYVAALQLARELGERRLERWAINQLGTVEHVVGHTDEALLQFERALALARESDDRQLQGSLLGNIANLHAALGRMDQAQVRGTQALAMARETGDRRLEANMLCNLGMVYLVQERLSDAEAASEAALVVSREIGHFRAECIVLCNLGIVFERLGRAGEAQMHFEAAVRQAHGLADPLLEGQFQGYLGLLHARQGRHGEARICLDSGEGSLRGVSDQFGLGVLLTSRAEAHYLAGGAAAATAALAAAAAIAAEVGAGPTSEVGLALARVTALIASPRASARLS
jgi:predicted ATPase/DNA-binding winged helix-turn-helix (wHTH) protein